ncbi:hypothetical protein HN51_035747 [Arachis hypogaea]
MVEIGEPDTSDEGEEDGEVKSSGNNEAETRDEDVIEREVEEVVNEGGLYEKEGEVEVDACHGGDVKVLLEVQRMEKMLSQTREINKEEKRRKMMQ